MSNLKWYAAFHNEGHHPHVHMIVYSTKPTEGYLSEKGVEKLRSSFARDIFEDELYEIYDRQTQQRDALRTDSRKVIAEIVEQINNSRYENIKVEALLLKLNERLSKTSGKKVYGYLKADVKDIVDEIVKEISKDDRIQRLYDLWYEQRENVLRTYTDEMPERIPLADNKEFKSLKNAVIQEALNLSQPDFEVEEGELEYPERINSNENSRVSLSPFRLLKGFRNIIQDKINSDNRQIVDKKLYRKIEEKKIAQDLH